MRAPHRPRPRTSALLLALLAGAPALGCTAAQRRTGLLAERLVDQQNERVLGDRESWVEHPAPPPEPDEAAAARAPAEPVAVDLHTSLALAVAGNRDYRRQLESLYLTALSLVGTRHSFHPRLSSILSHVFADGKGFVGSNATSASLGASQILGWGGTLSVDASTSVSDSDLAHETYGSSYGIRFVQPLLRGAGYAASHESLIQAERNLVYAVRDFELFREDFSIDVAQRFYALVQSMKQIDNQQENLEQASFDRRKAQALFEVERLSEVEVLRAQRQELNSKNALLGAQERLARSLEEFAIFLGLPEGVRIRIEAEEPEFVPAEYDFDSAVDVALANRLDLHTLRETVDDTERRIRLARNGLQPDLDVAFEAGAANAPARQFDQQELNGDFQGSVTLGLPLDRVFEANNLRSAEVDHARALRAYDQARQSVAVAVRSAIRELNRRRSSVEITETLIRGEEKNKRMAEMQFERGEIDNRELVDAEQSLLRARNTLIDEKVSYEIARLRLLRNMGVLFIDDHGMWIE